MPNWIEGTLKLRGKPKDIKRFMDNEFDRSNPIQGELEDYVKDESEKGALHYIFNNLPYIKGTRRCFLKHQYIDLWFDEGEDKDYIVVFNIQQAWNFDKAAGDKGEQCTATEMWKEKANEYHLDIRLYGIESGGEFCQEMIVLKDDDNVKFNTIKYDDWYWECPFPEMGS